ncbi:MAG: MerR family transcriptional regulator [Pseudomonadales bacterium]|nr:MerR family transcriptional regulator [Pseudomonadales bacterium]
MQKKSLTIGRVAKQVGVNVETIRFYQRQGLISQPVKPSQGYRCYPDQVIERLRFIQRAKALGFTLAEISSLLELSSSQCSATRQLGQVKLDLIRAKIADLQAMERALASLLTQCDVSQKHSDCPIIAALNKEA